MREANMKKRRWPWIVGITAVVAVLVGPIVFGSLNQVTQYETFEVKPTEVIKTVSANGQLAETQLLAYGPSEEPVLVSANGSTSLPAQFGISLEIKEIQVKAGDEVKADDVLFSYLNQIGQSVEVLAISDGLVRSIDTAAGLRTSGSVLTVGSAQPVVSVFVSEYDADLVTLGQKATIELDAINAVFEGEVVRIGQVAQSVSGIKQYEVLVDVTAIPEGARFGMSATAVIEVQKKSDVLAVPMSSLIGDVPEVEILIVDADGKQSVETVTVELGLAGDSLVEITSGLKTGDQVVTGVSGTIPAPVNFGPPPGARNSG
jgi:multidrug efflux pump subunit AcrA (membrane-fusion protein)